MLHCMYACTCGSGSDLITNQVPVFMPVPPEFFLATMLSGIKGLSLTTTYVIFYLCGFNVLKLKCTIFKKINILMIISMTKQICTHPYEFLN